MSQTKPKAELKDGAAEGEPSSSNAARNMLLEKLAKLDDAADSAA